MLFPKEGDRKISIFLIASAFLAVIAIVGMIGNMDIEVFYKVLDAWKWIAGFVVGGNVAEHLAKKIGNGDKK